MRRLVIHLILILSAVSEVLSIKCYQCKSMEDGKCGEEFRESPNMVVDCDALTSDFYPPIKATFCRKLLQKSECILKSLGIFQIKSN